MPEPMATTLLCKPLLSAGDIGKGVVITAGVLFMMGVEVDEATVGCIVGVLPG